MAELDAQRLHVDNWRNCLPQNGIARVREPRDEHMRIPRRKGEPLLSHNGHLHPWTQLPVRNGGMLDEDRSLHRMLLQEQYVTQQTNPKRRPAPSIASAKSEMTLGILDYYMHDSSAVSQGRKTPEVDPAMKDFDFGLTPAENLTNNPAIRNEASSVDDLASQHQMAPPSAIGAAVQMSEDPPTLRQTHVYRFLHRAKEVNPQRKSRQTTVSSQKLAERRSSSLSIRCCGQPSPAKSQKISSAAQPKAMLQVCNAPCSDPEPPMKPDVAMRKDSGTSVPSTPYPRGRGISGGSDDSVTSDTKQAISSIRKVSCSTQSHVSSLTAADLNSPCLDGRWSEDTYLPSLHPQSTPSDPDVMVLPPAAFGIASYGRHGAQTMSSDATPDLVGKHGRRNSMWPCSRRIRRRPVDRKGTLGNAACSGSGGEESKKARVAKWKSVLLCSQT